MSRIVDLDAEQALKQGPQYYEEWLRYKGAEIDSLKIRNVLDSPQFEVIAFGSVIEVLDAELHEDYSFSCKLRYVPEVGNYSRELVSQGIPDAITVGIDGKPPLFNSKVKICSGKCKDYYIELFYNKRS